MSRNPHRQPQKTLGETMNEALSRITDGQTALSRLRKVNPRLKPWATPTTINGFIDAAPCAHRP